MEATHIATYFTLVLLYHFYLDFLPFCGHVFPLLWGLMTLVHKVGLFVERQYISLCTRTHLHILFLGLMPYWESKLKSLPCKPCCAAMSDCMLNAAGNQPTTECKTTRITPFLCHTGGSHTNSLTTHKFSVFVILIYFYLFYGSLKKNAVFL